MARAVLSGRAVSLLLGAIIFLLITIRILFMDSSTLEIAKADLMHINQVDSINKWITDQMNSFGEQNATEIILFENFQNETQPSKLIVEEKTVVPSIVIEKIVDLPPPILPLLISKLTPNPTLNPTFIPTYIPTQKQTTMKSNHTKLTVNEILKRKEKFIEDHLISKNPIGLIESPSDGTNILNNPNELIKHKNQSQAIIPALQLKHTFTVYFCKHLGHGVRFFYLSREGLLLHPRITLVSNPDTADVIVYLPVSSPWHKTECNKPYYKNKTIILDEGDGSQLFNDENNEKIDWLLYFKRSYVRRDNGIFKGYLGYLTNSNVFPMTYTLAEAYLRLIYNDMSQRNLDIVCTLRGSKHDPTRLRIREWIEEYVKARGIKNAVAGEVNSASRTVVSGEYFSYMYRAK